MRYWVGVCLKLSIIEKFSRLLCSFFPLVEMRLLFVWLSEYYLDSKFFSIWINQVIVPLACIMLNHVQWRMLVPSAHWILRKKKNVVFTTFHYFCSFSFLVFYVRKYFSWSNRFSLNLSLDSAVGHVNYLIIWW